MRRIARLHLLRLLIFLGLLSTATTTAWAQGRTDYFNVESPLGHPLEVVTLGGHDYLVACNTRNNSVEIFDTDETTTGRLLATVRTGLEPVSVRFNRRLSRLFVANFLGDSVSVIALSAPAGPGSLTAQLDHTTWVGDEPIDVAFYRLATHGDISETFFVTHMGLDGIDWRDTKTFAPINNVEMVPAAVTLMVTNQSGETITLERAVKEPRTVLVREDELFVLALKGGDNALDANDFDMDLYCDDLTAPFANPVQVGNLHTTGLNMAFDSGGVLYVVGGEARNKELFDEENVKNAETGFLESMFYRVENPCSDNPTISRRDVNLEIATVAMIPPAPSTQTILRPVSKGKALSMLTDVVVYEDGSPVPKVFFTAQSNDRVARIAPDPAVSDPNAWKIKRVSIPTLNGSPLAGPTGLAIKLANPEMLNDPGDRLYVLNHFDGSIATVDPTSVTLVAGGQLSLSHDPRPDHLTQGQRFLYDAKLSGNGFVGCVSCHIFGRTDGLPWDLGTPDADPADLVIPPLLPDGIDVEEFPADKGNMVTQSLQGLLNFELSQADQIWVTNGPYHWRGDRATFVDFNGAFASLLGGSELEPQQMKEFEEFINTIHYPPNPKQLPGRALSGVFDDGLGGAFPNDGSTGANRGLKHFHITATVNPGRACGHCHFLTESSNNLLTEIIGGQPIETAAMRGLLQKEAKRDVDGFSDPKDSPYTGIEGLLHTGGGVLDPTNLQEVNPFASINAFNKTGFSDTLCNTPGQVSFCDELGTLNQFIHESDWGVGPLIGCPMTVDSTNATQAQSGAPSSGCKLACSDLGSSLACMEEQADLANSSVAVQAHLVGGDRGFWYDPRTSLYVEEPDSGQSIDRDTLVGLIGGPRERLVFQAVPLGNERRIAAPSGDPQNLPDGPQPSSLELLPMLPNTMYARLPELSDNWNNFSNLNLESLSIHRLRLFQWGLILHAPNQNGFGVGNDLHHDAPRRFRVSGKDIRPGAQLLLAYHNDPNAGPVNPDGPLDQVVVNFIALPLFPTDDKNPQDGLPIYETGAELEPLMYYGLMLGGPQAPGVAPAFVDQKPFTFPMQDPVLDKPELIDPATGQPTFDPVAWNFVYPIVINADGQFGEGGWQRLIVQ